MPRISIKKGQHLFTFRRKSALEYSVVFRLLGPLDGGWLGGATTIKWRSTTMPLFLEIEITQPLT